MSALVLDAGAFVAVDRGDRAMLARLRVAQTSGLGLRSTGGVIAQVWREPSGKQANLARLLKSVDVKAIDETVGKAGGLLLGKAGPRDAVDAGVVAVSATGDRIVTSDPREIRALVAVSGRTIHIVPC